MAAGVCLNITLVFAISVVTSIQQHPDDFPLTVVLILTRNKVFFTEKRIQCSNHHRFFNSTN